MSSLFGPAISDIWGKSTRRRKRRQAAEEDAESDEERGGARKRARGGAKKLPAEVAALLGEAHAEVIGGDEERAISLLGEVVRRVPEAPDAYATLSEIYEGRGAAEDEAKALQLALVAAHLAPSDATAWRRVAVLSMEAARRAPADGSIPSPPRSPRSGALSKAAPFTDDERVAFDALSRVLKLDPRDAAAAADIAALYASRNMPGAATDELERFLAKQDGAGPRTTDEISLDLVLAEHAAAAGRAALAKEALARALEDAAEPAPQPGAAGARTDDDARRAETRQRAAIDLARLLYDEGDFDGARRALGSRRPDEPLDVAVVRGACEARAGDAARATEDWRGLVRQCRGLAQALADGGGGADVEDYYDEQARLVDAVLDALGDLAPAVTEQMHELLAALLDAAARLHGARAAVEEDRAGGGSPHRGDEARAHATLARLLRERGALVAARGRVKRALAACAGSARALGEDAALTAAEPGGARAWDPAAAVARLLKAAGPPPGAGAGLRRRAVDDEVVAWTAFAESLAARVDVARDPADARRLVAVAAAVLESSCAGDALAPEAAALAGAAVAVAPRGERKGALATLRATREALLDGDLRAVFDRVSAAVADASPRARRHAAKSALARCCAGLDALGHKTVADASVGDLIAVHAVGLRPVDDGALARVAAQRGVDAVRAAGGPDACAAVKRLAAAAAAAAGDPRDPKKTAALAAALAAADRPAAGAAAVAAAATVHAALATYVDDDGALHDDAAPRRRPRAPRKAKDGDDAAPPPPPPPPKAPPKPAPPLLLALALHRCEPRRALALVAPPAGGPPADEPPSAPLLRCAVLADCATRGTASASANAAASATVAPTRSGAALRAAAELTRYAELRGTGGAAAQEVAYNTGRFFHALGLEALAAAHYRDALDGDGPADLLVTRSAALNLVNLYAKDPATRDHAREILAKHLVIK